MSIPSEESDKRSWCWDITLRRTFDGTKEGAVELAKDDFEWYESQLDGNENVNYPCSLTIQELPYQGEGYIKSEEEVLI